jgi:O-antigen ligase
VTDVLVRPVPSARTESRPRARATSGLSIAVLVGLHALLGVFAHASAEVATVHALATLAVGLGLAAFDRRPDRALYVCAYVVGAEVMWRSTEARAPWEAGKYVVVAILGLLLVRLFRGWRRAVAPIVFLLLLLPSALVTFQALGWGAETRNALAFNLSGPVALAVSVLLFSQLRVSRLEMRNVLWSMMLPIVSSAAIALFTTVTAETIEFTSESTFVTSGGFGPNQVATILGLGVMCGLFLVAIEPVRWLRPLSLALALWFGAQAALTLSRGGLYSAGIALAVGGVLLLRGRGRRLGLAAVVVLLGVAAYLLIPVLNDFTGGQLSERYGAGEASGRERIVQADLALWRSSPLIGVGAGMSAYERVSILDQGVAAHTEFTRLLAEHGVPGLVAIILMLVMAFGFYRRAPDALAKAFVGAFVVWSMSEMLHSAMRLVAMSFVFGLAAVGWKTSIDRESASQR